MLNFIYISVVSLAVILIFYLPLVLYLSKQVRNSLSEKRSPSQRKWIVRGFFIVLMLIPTWDVVVGTVNLNLLCAIKGGGYVNKKIYVDGFFYSVGKSTREMALTNYGFKFIEGKEWASKPNEYVRYGNKNGVIEKHKVTKLKSEYEIRSDVGKSLSWMENPFNLKIKLTEHYVRDIKKGKKMGGYKQYFFQLGWLDQFLLSGFQGAVVYCSDTPFGNKKKPLFNFGLNTLYSRKE